MIKYEFVRDPCLYLYGEWERRTQGVCTRQTGCLSARDLLCPSTRRNSRGRGAEARPLAPKREARPAAAGEEEGEEMAGLVWCRVQARPACPALCLVVSPESQAKSSLSTQLQHCTSCSLPTGQPIDSRGMMLRVAW